MNYDRVGIRRICPISTSKPKVGPALQYKDVLMRTERKLTYEQACALCELGSFIGYCDTGRGGWWVTVVDDPRCIPTKRTALWEVELEGETI